RRRISHALRTPLRHQRDGRAGRDVGADHRPRRRGGLAQGPGAALRSAQGRRGARPRDLAQVASRATMLRRCAAAVAVAMPMLATAQLAAAAVDMDRILEQGKRADVHRVDPALPRMAFSSWIGRVAGPRATIIWYWNDCDEGASEDPSPICISADAYL